jgi:hypothetical protein
LFLSLLATGSLGGACGPCDPESTTIVLRLPPANPGGTPPPAFDPLSISPSECERVCGPGYTVCEAVLLDGDLPAVECVVPNDCGAGRRPRALRGPRLSAGSPTQAWLAQAAHLEAASVHAFEQLASELVTHGAPLRLVARARRAARDEVRHARVLGRRARAAGAAVPRVELRRTERARSLVELAVHNAVEGCVGEAFAALVALHQAEHAATPELRRCFVRIARDETAHAALALAIDRWTSNHLSPSDRARVARAKARAAARLVRSYGAHASARHALGLPSAEAARALATRLGEALGWGGDAQAGSRSRASTARATRTPSSAALTIPPA